MSYSDSRTRDAVIDAAFVTGRLEEAGAALLALPNTGWTTKLRTTNLEIVRIAMDDYGAADKRIRPPVPSASEISRMDEALGWILLIPIERHVLRRIVGARSLVNPMTERHLFPWRRLAAAMGADHKAVQRWHAEGIKRIVAALNGHERTGAAIVRRPASGRERPAAGKSLQQASRSVSQRLPPTRPA
jgi:hypothetical protein